MGDLIPWARKSSGHPGRAGVSGGDFTEASPSCEEAHNLDVARAELLQGPVTWSDQDLPDARRQCSTIRVYEITDPYAHSEHLCIFVN
jgi:hypothetical protein